MVQKTPRRTPGIEITSIAEIVGGDRKLDGERCTDGLNREWQIVTKHSGCALVGKNHEAQIPYWTCYYIELPGLRLGRYDPSRGRDEEPGPSLLVELLRLSVKDGDLIQDSTQGLLWVVKVGEYGLNLEGYDDNHYMPMCSLGVLSFGELIRISTAEQRAARKREWKGVN